MNDPLRRLILRLIVKLLILATILLAFWVLLGSIRCSGSMPRPAETSRHTIHATAQQPLQRIPWAGGNVIVLFRDQALLEGMQHARPAGELTHRAKRASWLVLYDRGGDMNCPLEWHGPGDHRAPFRPWPGGFREACRNQWFDAAGRSLGRHADITIPPHHWQGENLLILGENGDNPAP